MKKSVIIVFLCFVCVLSSCDVSASPKDSIKIVSWNVQNIFDDVDDGSEYEEYTSQGHWSSSLYKLRLDNLNTVFSYDELSGADIVVLNEVENEKTVRDIIHLKSFSKNSLIYYVCAGAEDGAISSCIISKYPISKVNIHEVENCRPVIEAQINADRTIYVLACHAKSRREGVEQTSDMRLEAGRVIELVKDMILSEDSDAMIVACGDFNEDWKDENIFERVFTGVSFSEAPVKISGEGGCDSWYCFWLDQTLDLQSEGSYYYGGKWSCFDNILVYGRKPENAGVVSRGILVKTDKTPNAWIRKSANGVSDHLPVFAVLKR